MGTQRTTLPDTRYAWLRLAAATLLSTIGGVGMWSVVVVLPAVQREFGVDRADAALPYTLGMIGLATGSVLMGRFADRFGIMFPTALSAISLALGYVATAQATSLWQFAIAHGILVSLFGSSATFAPLMADTSLWFTKQRGLAVAICASGSYLAGTVWPPLIQSLVESVGWRQAHLWIGLVCIVTMLPISLALRRASPLPGAASSDTSWVPQRHEINVSPRTLQTLLVLASFSCCVAMSMPQVHIVAYCSDLGYGAARGAEMLSLMLGLGIVSRLASGLIADKIGGLRTLLLGSVLQGLTITLFLPFDSLASLYAVSAVFGLVQGGLTPSYAIIVREYFGPHEAGTRVGIVMMANLGGMAFGGWLTGAIFDQTGSYQAAFINGTVWNIANIAIVSFLISRISRPSLPVAAAA